jgi:hypothetical protein
MEHLFCVQLRVDRRGSPYGVTHVAVKVTPPFCGM